MLQRTVRWYIALRFKQFSNFVFSFRIFAVSAEVRRWLGSTTNKNL